MRWHGRIVALLISICSSAVFCQDLPNDFILRNAASGKKFNLPVGIAFAPGNRIYVTEKRGRVYVIQDGEKVDDPFINLESEVLSNESNGLLGIAVDPDFDNNPWVYLLYTVDPTGGLDDDIFGFSRLVRYRSQSDNLNEADLSTRQVLIGNDWSDGIIACGQQHVIGSLRWGTDGTLLVSAGEASLVGVKDDGHFYPECFEEGRFSEDEDIGAFRSQYIGSLAGKVLRIDKETGRGLPSNPYYTGNPDDKQSKVWAYGLRNPFRFNVRPNGSSDPADGNPGSIYIGDVGWGTWEDLNVSPAGGGGGENFGWPCFEGPDALSTYHRETPDHHDCSSIGTPENPADETPPIIYWHHTNPSLSVPPGYVGASVTAGPFYTGTRYPRDYWGAVFFADYEHSWIRVLEVDENDNPVEVRDFAEFDGGRFEHGIVDLETDPVTGDLFYVDIAKGTVNQFVYTGEPVNQDPVAIATADISFGSVPLTVHFSGNESVDPDGDELDFDWDFGTGNISDEVNPVYTFTQMGNFEVVLEVTDSQGASSRFFLEVIVGSEPPQATILQPAISISVLPHETVQLSGEGFDPDEPESNLTYNWLVDLHHNDHLHPASFEIPGKTGSFAPGDHGDPWDLIYLKVRLEVTDTAGLVGRDTAYVIMNVPGEEDITDSGTPIALVTTPSGSGSRSLDVIHDNVYPQIGSADFETQYDTFTGVGGRQEDWIGYEFPGVRRFSKLVFQEGLHSEAGGWFESFFIEVRENGVWRQVNFVNTIPPYHGNNEAGFEIFTLLFSPETGDAVRLIGAPGGSDSFISVAELRTIETPVSEPLSFAPIEDARVRSTSPGSRYGDEPELHLELNERDSYLKFDVTGISGTVTEARLRLYTLSGSDHAGDVYLVSNNFKDSTTPWNEEELKYENAPLLSGAPIATLGEIDNDEWAEFDVTSAISANGIFSFGLRNHSNDRAKYSSKEGNQVPELFIQLGTGDSGGGDGHDHIHLNVSVDGQGSIDLNPPGGEYDENTQVTLTAQPASGWLFSHWNGDLSGSTNPETIILDSDKTVTAVFTEETGGEEGGTFTFVPTQDGQVKLESPDKKYGSKESAKADQGNFRSYFKFEVSGISGTVTQARLRFYVVGSSDDGGDIFLVSNDFTTGGAWVEDDLNFNNAPSVSGLPVANLGPVSSGNYAEVDITGAVAGNGAFSFAIKSESGDESQYYTKEGEFPPELVLTTQGGSGTEQFTLAAATQGSGSVGFSPPGGVYNPGSQVQLTAQPVAGWQFDGWSGDLGGSVNPVTITMNSNKNVTATFSEISVPQYTVTANVQGIGSVSLDPGDGVYVSGTNLQVTATPAEGWEFDHWSGELGGSSNPATFSVIRNSTVTAVFVEETGGGEGGTFTFTPSHDGQVKLESPEKNYGSKESAKADQGNFRSYFKFEVNGISGTVTEARLRFYVVGSSEDGGDIFLVSNDFSTGGAWVEEDLNFNNAPAVSGLPVANLGPVSSGNYAEVDITGAVAGNGAFSFAIKSESGDESQYYTKEGEFPPELILATQGSGGAEQFNLTVNTDGSGNVNLNPPGGTYDNGTQITLTAQPADGWQFDHWNGDLSGGSNPEALSMTQNRSVTAVFVEETSGGEGGTFTFTPTQDGQVKLESPEKNYGSKESAKADQGNFRSYFKFEVNGISGTATEVRLRFYVVGASEDGGDIFSVSNDFSTGGAWDEDDLNFNNAPIVSGSPLANLGPVSSGNYAEIDITGAVAGNGTFSFAIKSESGDESQYYTKEGEFPPELILTTQGSGGVEQYHLTLTTEGSGNVVLNPPGGSYNSGTQVTLTAQPANGWEFDHWHGDLDGSTNPVTITMDKDKDVDAHFEETTVPEHSLTVQIEGVGSVALDPPGGTYSAGATVELTATPDPNWQFSGWSGDASGQDNPLSLQVDSDVDLTATFTEVEVDENTFTFTPISDAYVRSARPTNNYGKHTDLTVQNSSSVYKTYLKFDVQNLSHPVKQATLMLYVIDASPDGGDVYSVSNNYSTSSTAWHEDGLLWTNAPEIASQPLNSIGEIVVDTWIEVDVTAAITGNGVFSLALDKESGGKGEYSSKDGSHAPKLVVETNPDIQAGNQPPVAVNDNVSTSPGLPVVMVPAANDFDPDGTVVWITTTVVDHPDHGSVLVNPNSGVTTYTPNSGFSGSDAFTYTIKDNEGATSNVATVSITVGSTSAVIFAASEQGIVQFANANSVFEMTHREHQESYLKFVLPSFQSQRIRSARLELVAGERRTGSGMIYLASDAYAGSLTPWASKNLDARNLPTRETTPIGALGDIVSGEPVAVDVTSAVAKGGAFSFAVDGQLFANANTFEKPRLVVDFAEVKAGNGLQTSRSDSTEATDEATPAKLPESFALSPGFPNPFNAATTFTYELPHASRAKIQVFNVKGQLVRTLVDEQKKAGVWRARWSGENDAGLEATSGIYFVRFQASGHKFVEKISLQK